MFRHILVATVAAFCLAFAQVGVGDMEGMGVNHVVNPSFEQPAKGSSLPDGWLGPPTVFSRDSETAPNRVPNTDKSISLDKSVFQDEFRRLDVRINEAE